MSYGEAKKYDIAREFRQGASYCVQGGGLDRSQSEHWKKGWEWAYTNLKPKLNDGTQEYIVGLGFKPFQQVEAMREKGMVYCPDCNGHEFTFANGMMKCVKCERLFNDIAD